MDPVELLVNLYLGSDNQQAIQKQEHFNLSFNNNGDILLGIGTIVFATILASYEDHRCTNHYDHKTAIKDIYREIRIRMYDIPNIC